MTNGDKIRSMTDEEFAKSKYVDNLCQPVKCDFDIQCSECWLRWLEQECKDGKI